MKEVNALVPSGLRIAAVSILIAILASQSLVAQVTFSVSPSTVSNTYSGNLTLQIGGLNSGETVVVQKYLDLNANGVIDSGDLLVQQFRLTDGQVSTIGGITNINVPGDLNGAAGAITAQLNLKADFMQRFVGQYLLKLSSPSGRFAPQTTAMTVTGSAYGQSVSGNVVSSGTNVPNALIIVFVTGGSPLGGTVANASGHYSLPVPPGSYAVLPARSNYVAARLGAVVNVGSGAAAVTNASLIPATQSISGVVADAANLSVGLPGLLLPFQSADGLVGIGVTDTNGTFTARVNPNQWKVGGATDTLLVQGYVATQNKLRVDTTSGSVAGVTIAYPRATALIYGRVRDAQNQPVAGIDLFYNDVNGQYGMDAYTDANGNYAAAAVGGATWLIGPSSDSNPTNYLFSESQINQNGGTNLMAGQAVPQNFTAVLATNYLTGHVQTASGSPIVGVGVYAYASVNGVDLNQGPFPTDSNGNYSLNVVSGTWNVGVHCSGGSDSLDNILGGGNYQCPNNETAPISNSDAVVNFVIFPPGSVQLFGYVRNASGNPIPGVTVRANGMYPLSANTDVNGYYAMNVSSGSWDVGVDCSGLSALGLGCVSDYFVNVSGTSVEVDFVAQPCGPLQVIGPTALPDATAGQYYALQLPNSGCNPPFAWSLSPGSQPLPGGLTLSGGGLLSGVPTNPGSNSFSVRVQSATGDLADKTLSLMVDLGGSPPQLSSPASMGMNQFQLLVQGTAGQTYTLQMSTNLASTNWTSIQVTNASGSTLLLTDPNATNASRFYRIKVGL